MFLDMKKFVVFPTCVVVLFLLAAVEAAWRGSPLARVVYWLAAALINICVMFM